MRDGKVWGEEFADDGWQELISVEDWSLVSSDEFVRLFPALVPRDGRVPDPVRNLVIARASARDDLREPEPSERDLENRRRLWDPDECDRDLSRARTSFVRDLRGPSIDRKSDAEFLREAVHGGTRTQLDEGFEADMARFAYLACVHPAYVWPAASATAYWGTTLAWLGALARCGRARMPEEVAEYLHDILAPGSDGAPVCRDRLIGAFMEYDVDSEALRRAVRQRRNGVDVIVHRSRTTIAERWLAPSLSRLFGRLGAALKPATAMGPPRS